MSDKPVAPLAARTFAFRQPSRPAWTLRCSEGDVAAHLQEHEGCAGHEPTVDRLYRRARFVSERERIEYLFALYERLQAPLAAEAAAKPRRRRRWVQ